MDMKIDVVVAICLIDLWDFMGEVLGSKFFLDFILNFEMKVMLKLTLIIKFLDI
jgi:hypothetical protein